MPHALITGASSGIGRALAGEFARHGWEVALVGRDAKALAAAAAECRAAGAPTASVHRHDLADPQAPARLQAELGERSPDAFVNNAGIGAHGDFAETDLARELELSRLRVDATLRLTKLFLPAMRARGSGRILNVSSVYAYAAVPHQAVYGAVQAFLLSFSEALAFELQGTGVTVSVVCPGSTRTAFRGRAGAGESKGMAPEAGWRARRTRR